MSKMRNLGMLKDYLPKNRTFAKLYKVYAVDRLGSVGALEKEYGRILKPARVFLDPQELVAGYPVLQAYNLLVSREGAVFEAYAFRFAEKSMVTKGRVETESVFGPGKFDSVERQMYSHLLGLWKRAQGRLTAKDLRRSVRMVKFTMSGNLQDARVRGYAARSFLASSLMQYAKGRIEGDALVVEPEADFFQDYEWPRKPIEQASGSFTPEMFDEKALEKWAAG